MARKRKFSREEILQAALQLVDTQGLEKCSMRKLGEVLNVKAMSLYNYFSNKGELLDGVYEQVLKEMVYPERTGNWIADLRGLAFAFRAVLRKHPKVLPLFATRPALSEGSISHMNAAFEILQEPFPEPLTQLYTFQVLVTFVIGNTMYQYGPILAAPLPANDADLYEDFPMLHSMEEALGSHDPEAEFAFGLDAMLDGLKNKAEAHKTP